MSRIFAMLFTTALLAGCAQGPTQRQEADRRALAEARPVGEPVGCIDLVRIDYTRVRDGRTIDFHVRGREVYRNTLPDVCPGLAFEDSFTYRISLSRLCSVDTIQVTGRTGVSGPTCALGQFQRIETNARQAPPAKPTGLAPAPLLSAALPRTRSSAG